MGPHAELPRPNDVAVGRPGDGIGRSAGSWAGNQRPNTAVEEFLVLASVDVDPVSADARSAAGDTFDLNYAMSPLLTVIPKPWRRWKWWARCALMNPLIFAGAEE